jgi:hypothetical protein
LEERLKGRLGPRVLCSALTVSAVSIGWIFVTMGDVASVWEYMTHVSHENLEYFTDLLLVTLSGRKFLLLAGIGGLLLLPSIGIERLLRRRMPRMHAVYEVTYAVLVLLLFLFTILFFLPRYGSYNSIPFRFVYL